ncbi:hypothetical protein U0035_04320 [Niabella yanshanensis]|uniref:Uncharacterized protein n=1 Tax=Niabella yanshanensis TaxID=577386 RepID=A0ABZ0WBK3_9BACT|nr:hypothetical protein [Niabella yanshanensis]WQD39370.1 hypothetical protein U0035_04320 [Niabella yanshanensis]
MRIVLSFITSYNEKTVAPPFTALILKAIIGDLASRGIMALVLLSEV